MSFDFDALRKSIKRPRQAVDLCLRGDLVEARNRLIRDLTNRRGSESLAGDPDGANLRAKLAEVEAEISAAVVVFTFEAVNRDQFAQLEEAHKYRDDGTPTRDLEVAVTAASLVEPDLSVEQVGELFGELSEGQVSELVAAAWGVNRETGSVPFVASASDQIG